MDVKVQPYDSVDPEKNSSKEFLSDGEQPEKNRPLYHGNWNLWLLLGAALSIYFTGYIGMPILFLQKIQTFFFIHLIFVAIVSWGW